MSSQQATLTFHLCNLGQAFLNYNLFNDGSLFILVRHLLPDISVPVSLQATQQMVVY